MLTLRRFLIVLLALTFLHGCTTTARQERRRASLEAALFEITVRDLHQTFNPANGQFCIQRAGFFRDPGKPIPRSLQARVSDLPGLGTNEWCSSNPSRVLAVGPVTWFAADGAGLWGYSSVATLSGGYTCHQESVLRAEKWSLLPCKVGSLIN